MGDNDEVMRFEITDQDLDDEMTTSYGRKRMSKNQATYGIWADNSDSEGEPRAGFGSNKGKRDFTASIGFVSGGIVGQKKKKDEEEQEESAGSSDEEADTKSRAGGSGLGYRSKAGRVESEGQVAGMRSQGYSHRAWGRGLGTGRNAPRVLGLSCC